jgi:hypothetical protein
VHISLLLLLGCLLAHALHHKFISDDFGLILLLFLLLFILLGLFLQLEISHFLDTHDFSQGHADILASLLGLLHALTHSGDLLIVLLHRK